jgi:hypothetical protein
LSPTFVLSAVDGAVAVPSLFEGATVVVSVAGLF